MVQTSATCEDIGQAVWDGMFGAEDVDSYEDLHAGVRVWCQDHDRAG